MRVVGVLGVSVAALYCTDGTATIEDPKSWVYAIWSSNKQTIPTGFNWHVPHFLFSSSIRKTLWSVDLHTMAPSCYSQLYNHDKIICNKARGNMHALYVHAHRHVWACHSSPPPASQCPRCQFSDHILHFPLFKG